jgi:hypothetical protein
MSLALDNLSRDSDRPLYDLLPMTEVITWRKASLVSAWGKHDTVREDLDATYAAIGKLRNYSPHPRGEPTQLERFAGAPAADGGAGRSSPLRGCGELGSGETQWIEPITFERMVSGSVTVYGLRRQQPWACQVERRRGRRQYLNIAKGS